MVLDTASVGDLELFVHVCDAGNLSDIARELGCTQPAVSQRVRRLERDVGAPLLDRHQKGVKPTEAGRLLYDAIVDGIGSLRSVGHQIEQLAKGEAGSVRITTGGTAVKHLLSGAIARFRRDHPMAVLELASANSTRRCLEALRKEEADLAWITMGTDVAGVELRPALTMPWTLVGPVGDPFMQRRSLRLADLKGLRYIPLREQAISQTQLSEAFAQAGLVLDTRASVDDWDTAALLVELDLGYTLVPAIHGWNFAREGRVRALRIEGLKGVTFGWAARRWNNLSPLTLGFVNTVSTEMSRLKGVSGLRVLG